MNDCTEKLEALREQHRRLRVAAQAVIDAAQYATAGEDEARVVRLPATGLKRELDGKPQPHGLAWMSVT
jgi:hypothetical protein